MELYAELFIIFSCLLFMIAAGLILSVRSHRRHVRQLRRLTREWQLHTDYLVQMDALSREASSVTRQVRALAEAGSSAFGSEQLLRANRSCLADCSALLHHVYTGNPIVDALLFSKKNACEKQGIEFSVDISALPQKGISEVELTALLGNLLDNAMEAAAGSSRPQVSLRSEVKKSVWIVKTKNTKNPALDPVSRNMKTTKPDKGEHGLGLSIVRQLIEQYNGSLTFEDMESWFEATAMLML